MGRFRKVKLLQGIVDRAKPEEARYVLTDTALAGFWLVVEPTGRKSYKLRYRVGGGRGATVRVNHGGKLGHGDGGIT